MKKEKIKNILLIVIVALVTSFVTAYGVSSTFDSSNVCYKVDSNTGASVQDTIDDLYGRASDYSELKSYFQNNPTSYFDGDILRIGKNSTSTTNWKELLFYHNDNIRSRLYYTPSTDKTILSAGNSSGTAGQGTLELQGNPVTINGTSFTSKWDLLGGACSLNTSGYTNYTISNINSYLFIRINMSYYSNGLPDYGGITIPVAGFKRATTESYYIPRYNGSHSISVRYVNDTTIAVRQEGGTSSTTSCVSIHGVF